VCCPQGFSQVGTATTALSVLAADFEKDQVPDNSSLFKSSNPGASFVKTTLISPNVDIKTLNAGVDRDGDLDILVSEAQGSASFTILLNTYAQTGVLSFTVFILDAVNSGASHNSDTFYLYYNFLWAPQPRALPQGAAIHCVRACVCVFK